MRATHVAAVVTLITTLTGATGAPLAQTPAYQWGRSFSAAATQTGTVVGATSGAVFLGGNFDGSINLGGVTHNSAGLTDLFLASFDQDGTFLWSFATGSASTQGMQAMAVDASGSVYIAGQFQNTVNFGGGVLTSAGSFDTYLAKFNSVGAHQWSKSFGDAGLNQTPTGLALDSGGNVYLLGFFDGTMNFGGSPLTNAGGGFDTYLAKFNSAGTHQWSKQFGDAVSGTQYPNGISIGPSDVVYIAGYFTGSVDFGAGNLTSAGDGDAFLVKFTSAGAIQWAKRMGSSNWQRGIDVEADGGTGVFLYGYFEGDINPGGGTFTSAGGSDLFVAKYNSSGTHQWSRQFGGTDQQIASAIEVSGLDVYLTGYFEDSVDFGGGALVSGNTSNDEIFFAKLDNATGAHRWSARYGTTQNDDFGIDLAVNGNFVYLTGSFEERLDFGHGDDLLAPTASRDAFLARFHREAAEPTITLIRDIGNDQGGQVLLRHARSGFDQSTTPVTITGYEIYLRDDPLPAAAMPAAAADAWILMQQVPAHMFSNYATVAATLADSTVDNGGHLSWFKVRAVTGDPATWFEGPVVAGYSLDNLAPGLPQNLVLADGVLSWDAPADGDVAHYTVYGSASAAFDASATLLDHATSTRFPLQAASFAHYFVTATDDAGNESRPAAVGGTGADGAGAIPRVLSLSAFPNPFNPATTLRYTLPAAGRVAVDVFDARGARVASLVDAEQPAGAYTAQWDGRDGRGAPAGSGVYFARITHAGATRAYKLVLLK